MKKTNLLTLIAGGFFILQANAQTTFNYTGAPQTYTVPSNVCFVEVDVSGARGTNVSGGGAGGMGGRVEAMIPVTAGETLNIHVGEQSTSPTGGWNGGGDGGASLVYGDGAGGGGASDIRQGGTGLTDRVVVAGGGGGGGCYSAGAGSWGGAGGGLTGQAGVFGGGGGTQSSGGNGGVFGEPGDDGTFGAGGDGYNSEATGGGGSGYYGGGGGSGEPNTTSCKAYAGGGGSNYTYPAARAVEHTRGYQSGNGQITITPVTGVSTPAIYGDTIGCIGDTASYTAAPVVEATSYNWSFPPGITIEHGQGTDSVVVTFDTTLTGAVEVSAVNNCDVSSPATLNITVIDPAADAGVDTTICPGDSVQLNAKDSFAIGYAWSPATGLSDPDSAITWAYPANTTIYAVTVTYNDVCTATDEVEVQVLSSPANAGPDAFMCAGDSVQLQSGGGDFYAWRPSTGLSDTTIANPWARPPNDTTTYTVTVTDTANGCTSADSVTVFVVSSLTADAGQDTTICAGDSVQLRATGGTGYLWAPSAGLSDPTIADPWADPSDTTQYFVTVSSGTCSPATDVITVNVIRPPADAGADTTICPGDSVQLNAAGPPSGTYVWSPAAGLSDTAVAAPRAAPSNTTVYTVTLTDGNGCTATDDVEVTVSPVADAGADAWICAGDSVRLQASGGDSYSWSPATGLSDPAIADPWASPSDTTAYTVEVTDSIGCTADDSAAVFVVPGLTAKAKADTTICAGESVPLNATGGTGYAWSPPAGLSCTNCQSPVAAPAATTSYVVTVSSGACTPDMDTVTVTVQTLPADAGADRSVCEGDSVQLSASGGESYAWSPATGLSDPTAANPWADSPEEAITYTVTVTDTSGCTATDATTVTPLFHPVAGFTFEVSGNTVDFTDTSAFADSYNWDFGDENASTEASPEGHPYEAAGDYKACMTVSNTCGSDEHCETIVISSVPGLSAQPEVKVYPNPAGAYVTVEVTGIAASESFELHMYSMEGKQVAPPVEISREQQQTHAQVDVSELAEGFYLIRVVGESYILNEKVYVVE